MNGIRTSGFRLFETGKVKCVFFTTYEFIIHSLSRFSIREYALFVICQGGIKPFCVFQSLFSQFLGEGLR